MQSKERHKEYMKEWRKNNPDKVKKYREKGKAKRKEYLRKYHKEQKKNNPEYTLRKKKYYQKNKNYFKKKSREWYNKNKEKKAKEWKEKRKTVLEHYGSKCGCCGESINQFLAIDHIDNNGAEHRKTLKINIYDWLIRNKFPKGFQILCHNCNNAKSFYGMCPHDRTKSK